MPVPASRCRPPSEPPATSGARSRPASRPTSSTSHSSPTCAPGRGGHRRGGLEPATRPRASSASSVVTLIGPPRQPRGNHQLRRPARPRTSRSSRRTRPPRAARRGTSWPSTGRRSRRASPSRRPSTPSAGAGKTSVSRLERPRLAADVLQRQGRRADRLRERGHPGQGGGDRARVRDPAVSTILIENPIAVTSEAENRRRPRSSLDFLYTDQGQQDLRRLRVSPGRRVRARQEHEQVPGCPPGLFTIAEFGGWTKVDDPFFDDDGWVIQAEKDLGNPTQLSRRTEGQP